ncbi:hypothetical protein [Candidatus Amarobacter glycogenicus]|uniref:hypothetical protein n=1 Tax=Candidatus Amarobacter glycogenicus TaxID=3140699 RepID=UPI0031365CA8|nr:hypothetical protein [Dehalococcoidia bacterium]
MSDLLAGGPTRQRTVEVSVAQLAWIVAGTAFFAYRLAAFLSAPVGGVELDSLAGAWQAHAGTPDERFIPTLFQAISAYSFAFTTSEVPARLLALLASCSVPFALYRLRPSLGESGALAALVVVALDPVSILLGATAWHGGLDIALTFWLLVLLREEELADWACGAAGFLVATSGAVVLPVVLAFAAVRLLRQQYPTRSRASWAAGGAVMGGALAATSFGFGLQDPVLPPIAALARGFEATWSTDSTGALAGFYGFPVLGLGGAAALYHAYQCWNAETWPDDSLGLLVASAIAFTWVVASTGSTDPVPLAAAAVILALLIGKITPAAGEAISRISWPHAIVPLAATMLAALVVEAWVVDWARIDRIGDGRDKLIVTGLVIAAVACIGLLASNRRTAPALLLAPAGTAFMLLLSGASGVAFGGPNEPLPSPMSSVQGAEIREIALLAREQHGGQIVIHSGFERASTWPMRDSGSVIYASRIPAEATVVIWPVTEAAPEGFAVIEGQWSWEVTRHGPDGDFLDYLRWLSNRNILKTGFEPVAVYLRTTE